MFFEQLDVWLQEKPANLLLSLLSIYILSIFYLPSVCLSNIKVQTVHKGLTLLPTYAKL